VEDEAERGETPPETNQDRQHGTKPTARDITTTPGPGFADGLAAEQETDLFLGAILRFLNDELLPAKDKLTRWVWIKAEQCEVLDGLLHHHTWPQCGLAST
jgi:hypothetical protein